MNKYELLVKENTLKDFFNWWSNSQNKVMEVRTRDWKIAKEIGTRFKLPYGYSGVFVETYDQLKMVMKEYRELTTLWFGINPKKKYLTNGYNSYGGMDFGIKSISYIFIDLDRKKKNGRASEKEIKKIDDFANLLISDFKNTNIFKYCKLYSGNGIQLLIPLDIPIVMPSLKFENGQYFLSDTFEKYKRLIQQTIYNKLVIKYKDHLKNINCEIDTKCWNVGRVGALPLTYNFKYSEPILRGVLSYGKGENIGLSDSLFDELDNVVLYKNQNNNFISTLPQIRITKKTLYKNKLVMFLLNTKLPDGSRNSNLIFPLKCLLQQNGFNLGSEEIQLLKRKIERVQQDSFPFNAPNNAAIFNPSSVNNYCMNNGLDLLYPEFVLSEKPIKRVFAEHVFTWKNLQYAEVSDINITLNDTQNIRKCLYECHCFYDADIRTIYKMGHELIRIFGLRVAQIIYEKYLKYWMIK